MSVEDTVQSEVIKHLLDVSQIFRQSLGSHCRILNHTNRFCVALHSSKESESRLSQAPHLSDVLLIYSRAAVCQCVVAFGQCLFESIGFNCQGLLCLSRQFHYQQSLRVAVYKESVIPLSGITLAQFEYMPVNQFDGIRLMFQTHEVGHIAFLKRVAVHAYRHFFLRRQHVQIHLYLCDKSQCPFTSTHHSA